MTAGCLWRRAALRPRHLLHHPRWPHARRLYSHTKPLEEATVAPITEPLPREQEQPLGSRPPLDPKDPIVTYDPKYRIETISFYEYARHGSVALREPPKPTKATEPGDDELEAEPDMDLPELDVTDTKAAAAKGYWHVCTEEPGPEVFPRLMERYAAWAKQHRVSIEPLSMPPSLSLFDLPSMLESNNESMPLSPYPIQEGVSSGIPDVSAWLGDAPPPAYDPFQLGLQTRHSQADAVPRLPVELLSELVLGLAPYYWWMPHSPPQHLVSRLLWHALAHPVGHLRPAVHSALLALGITTHPTSSCIPLLRYYVDPIKYPISPKYIGTPLAAYVRHTEPHPRIFSPDVMRLVQNRLYHGRHPLPAYEWMEALERKGFAMDLVAWNAALGVQAAISQPLVPYYVSERLKRGRADAFTLASLVRHYANRPGALTQDDEAAMLRAERLIIDKLGGYYLKFYLLWLPYLRTHKRLTHFRRCRTLVLQLIERLTLEGRLEQGPAQRMVFFVDRLAWLALRQRVAFPKLELEPRFDTPAFLQELLETVTLPEGTQLPDGRRTLLMPRFAMHVPHYVFYLHHSGAGLEAGLSLLDLFPVWVLRADRMLPHLLAHYLALDDIRERRRFFAFLDAKLHITYTLYMQGCATQGAMTPDGDVMEREEARLSFTPSCPDMVSETLKAYLHDKVMTSPPRPPRLDFTSQELLQQPDLADHHRPAVDTHEVDLPTYPLPVKSHIRMSAFFTTFDPLLGYLLQYAELHTDLFYAPKIFWSCLYARLVFKNTHRYLLAGLLHHVQLVSPSDGNLRSRLLDVLFPAQSLALLIVACVSVHDWRAVSLLLTHVQARRLSLRHPALRTLLHASIPLTASPVLPDYVYLTDICNAISRAYPAPAQQLQLAGVFSALQKMHMGTVGDLRARAVHLARQAMRTPMATQSVASAPMETLPMRSGVSGAVSHVYDLTRCLPDSPITRVLMEKINVPQELYHLREVVLKPTTYASPSSSSYPTSSH